MQWAVKAAAVSAVGVVEAAQNGLAERSQVPR